MIDRRTSEDGAIMFDGWRSIRDAIDKAYDELERPRVNDIPTDEWNLAGLAIEAYAQAIRANCVECKRRMWPHETIRCLDCKSALCEECAPKHFWPNGRKDKPHGR